MAQGVDRRQVIALFLGQQRHLRAAGSLRLEPLAGWLASGRLRRDARAGVVAPVPVRLLVVVSRRFAPRGAGNWAGLVRSGLLPACKKWQVTPGERSQMLKC